MRSSRFWPAVLFTVALSVHAGAQQVDDATRSAARQLATDGSAAYQADDFAQAYDQFNRAYQLVHVPTVGIWAARSLVKLGRLVEASERYLEVERAPLAASAPAEHVKAQKDANEERAALVPRIPSVRVILDGADPAEVFVTLNDQLLPSALLGVKRPTDPGKLRVKGVRGEQVVDANVELAEGESPRRHVELSQAEPREADHRRRPRGSSSDARGSSSQARGFARPHARLRRARRGRRGADHGQCLWRLGARSKIGFGRRVSQSSLCAPRRMVTTTATRPRSWSRAWA